MMSGAWLKHSWFLIGTEQSITQDEFQCKHDMEEAKAWQFYSVQNNSVYVGGNLVIFLNLFSSWDVFEIWNMKYVFALAKSLEGIL